MKYFIDLNNYYSHRVIRFLRSYRLTEEEIQLLQDVFSFSIQILQAIAYYQEDDIEVYNRAYIKKK